MEILISVVDSSVYILQSYRIFYIIFTSLIGLFQQPQVDKTVTILAVLCKRKLKAQQDQISSFISQIYMVRIRKILNIVCFKSSAFPAKASYS